MRQVWAILAAVALATLLVHAQDTTVIFGKVVDSSGAIAVGAYVTLSRTGTAQTWRMQANMEGVFRFPGMLPGDYTLSVSAPGFVKQDVRNIVTVIPYTHLPPVVLQVAATYPCPGESILDLPWTTFEWRNPGDEATTGSVIPRMPDVKIVLSDGDHYMVVGEAKTGINGPFEFHGISAGLYRITAAHEGYADFIVNDLEVRARQITRIATPLEMEQCPKGLRCDPSYKVHVPVICL